MPPFYHIFLISEHFLQDFKAIDESPSNKSWVRDFFLESEPFMGQMFKASKCCQQTIDVSTGRSSDHHMSKVKVVIMRFTPLLHVLSCIYAGY